jgi:hypothetical protein
MHPADELRALAERYRLLAEVGCPSYRDDRLRWAENLEAQAEQLRPRTAPEPAGMGGPAPVLRMR